MKLAAFIQKETLLLFRDWHGLLLLFVMPLIFIVIMSLALQDVFSKDSAVSIDVAYQDNADNQYSRAYIELLTKSETFILQPVQTEGGHNDTGKIKLYLSLQPIAQVPMARVVNHQLPFTVQVEVEPDTESYITSLFTSLLSQAQAQVYLQKLAAQLQRSGISEQDAEALRAFQNLPAPAVQYRYDSEKAGQSQEDKAETVKPNSVQQNVPSWLVFAMFFIVVPLSNALLSEEQSGTLRRLKTYNVSTTTLLLGKLVPYFVINQIQVVLMICAGIWLMPMLGGDRFETGNSYGALCLLSAAISIMALGYGLCIAAAAKTTEQATTFGGVGNILLAALGGVMVPVFVMPQTMQQIAEFSPMYWAVQGYLDIVLRGGGVESILRECAQLLTAGLALLSLAVFLLNKRS